MRKEETGFFAFALDTSSAETAFSLLGFSKLLIQESGKARNRARIVKLPFGHKVVISSLSFTNH